MLEAADSDTLFILCHDHLMLVNKLASGAIEVFGISSCNKITDRRTKSVYFVKVHLGVLCK